MHGTHSQRSHVLTFIFIFFSSLILFSFLLHRLTPTAFFFSSSSFFFFIFFFTKTHELYQKKKNTHGYRFLKPKKIKPINTQTQTHKHVHPHNKSKNFFSKYKQNPEVRNEREEMGGEEEWNQSCMSFPAFLIGVAGSWWRRSAPLLPVGGDLASWVPVEIGTRWISFARDQCYLDLMRWRSALFGLGERKRMKGQRGVCTVCLDIGREWWKKKKKKKRDLWGERGYTRVW